MRFLITATVFVAILASCSTGSSPPPALVDAAAELPLDLAGGTSDLSMQPASDSSVPPLDAPVMALPDLAPAPDLWACTPQNKPGPCGCPGLACCEDNVQGHLVRFCAGTNTPTPDPAQRCFDPGAPTCLRCGGLIEPCCFDGTPAQLSCRPGLECRQVACARPDVSTCFACDVAGCGLQPGSPCCSTPPYVCANGLQCQAGTCR